MKPKGSITAEFHELKKGIAKGSGNEYRVLVLRNPEDFEKYEIFLTSDVALPEGLKSGDFIDLALAFENWQGKSSIKVKSVSLVPKVEKKF
ncbi:hypothetical protein [Candidatus Formimonas warabiya]|uniref:Uncharacterized protein n=1 Tax=Formimonas warabiya TaxID=1761012 RepID=A0A3G1KQ52_FORW1|nr:hypothetical protein [Candidatus Formimonas warabiya]ATW24265.1 hypothetical protein DCMF_05210 [Candidatus Formimonas warabiya]